MAGGARRRGVITEINVTPLVDIMLVLLIVFMLTAHLIAKQAIEINLPRASQSTTLQPSPLVIALKAHGELFLNETPIDADGLHAAIEAQVQKDPANPPQVVIAADKDVSHGRVVWVLDVVKRLGVTSFAIQIDPTELVAPGTP
jgi:biopolymer transport protein ExbD